VFQRSEIATEALFDEVIHFARKPGAGAAFRQLQRSEMRWDGFRTTYLDRFREIQVPTLIVHGARDPLVPVAWAERAHQLIPNSELEIIDEAVIYHRLSNRRFLMSISSGFSRAD